MSDKEQVREIISELLLLPGDGIDLNGFLGSLRRNEARAMALVGKTRVSHLLRPLLTNPRPEVRGRACIVLAEFPLQEKGCLQTIVNDTQVLPEDRKRAQELMREN